MNSGGRDVSQRMIQILLFFAYCGKKCMKFTKQDTFYWAFESNNLYWIISGALYTIYWWHMFADEYLNVAIYGSIGNILVMISVFSVWEMVRNPSQG